MNCEDPFIHFNDIITDIVRFWIAMDFSLTFFWYVSKAFPSFSASCPSSIFSLFFFVFLSNASLYRLWHFFQEEIVVPFCLNECESIFFYFFFFYFFLWFQVSFSLTIILFLTLSSASFLSFSSSYFWMYFDSLRIILLLHKIYNRFVVAHTKTFSNAWKIIPFRNTVYAVLMCRIEMISILICRQVLLWKLRNLSMWLFHISWSTQKYSTTAHSSLPRTHAHGKRRKRTGNRHKRKRNWYPSWRLETMHIRYTIFWSK